MKKASGIHHSSFWYETTNLVMFKEHPCYIEGGFILLCTEGEAIIATGIQQYRIDKDSTTMFLSGMSFFLLSASDNFNTRMFTFSEKLHSEVVLRLPPSFSQYMTEISVYKHPADSSTLKNVHIFMDMAELIHKERRNKYVDIMQRNFLQNYMVYVLEYVQPFLNQTTSKYNRRQQLFHRFISLLYTHCRQHHDIAFYAKHLCITSRYLYDITVECSPNLSPKQLIDKQLLLEIKTFLYSSDLTVTEIAYQLNLPDQSYLCRYFKRHTGISPTEYRRQFKMSLNNE